jgi:AcrR family transcriptional regulator
MPRLKAAQRRSQLIEVATKLFARGGFDATTTAAIAYAAGVTEPILYRHFRSKQEMFVAIVRDVSEATMNHWKQIISNVTNPPEQLRLICDEMPDHMKRFADEYHVLHGALSTSRDKKVLAVIREHYDEIEKFFMDIILEGQKTGGFLKDINAQSAAWQLITTGIGYGMITLNLMNLDRPMVTEMINAILRGLKP